LAVAVRRWRAMVVNAGLVQALLEAVLTLEAAGAHGAAIDLMRVVGPQRATWPLMPADMAALADLRADTPDAIVSPLEDEHIQSAVDALELVAS
jgi:hypothetical protein